MDHFDVIIVGAGPAGGQCARELTHAGKKVLLTEKSTNFSANNYSSAGAPLELMEMFDLPESIVGASWNKIMMHSSHEKMIWESPHRQGVVMNFAKLRGFLADEATNQGGEVRLGWSYQSHESLPDETIAVTFKDQSSQHEIKVKAQVLVDASGCERKVLAPTVKKHNFTFPSTGIEYLVEVKPEIYQKYANALSVFMGHKWMPQGYGWIFPMEPNTLKVGVGRYFQNDNFVPHDKSYIHYLHVIMKECLGGTDLPILDKHGKTIVYSHKQRDPYYGKGIIAIGDAVSTINPLAFEGIRHAMFSGRVAAKHILQHLEIPSETFEGYVKEMRQYFGYKWKLCELLMNVIYKEPRDERIDMMVKTFHRFSFDEMLDLAFQYRLSKAVKFLLGYTLTAGTTAMKQRLGLLKNS